MSRSHKTELEYHLRYNHYPPVSLDLIPFCEAAIAAVDDDEPERHVVAKNEAGKESTLRNGDMPITAGQLIEDLHLHFFLQIDDEEDE